MSRWFQLVLGMTCLAAIVVVFVSRTRPPSSSATAVPANEFAMPSAESNKPVGWVFGRMIGVPGADQPVLSGTGAMGGNTHVSPHYSH